MDALSLRRQSTVELPRVTLAMSTDWRLVARGESLEGLDGELSSRDGVPLVVGPANHNNIEWLRDRLPWLRPGLLGRRCSAGFGDRIGLATAGHVRALRSSGHGISPIFAQQSIREMKRSGRTPADVMDDATWGVFAEGWRDGFGADADHLKSFDDVDICAAAGYTFYTVDPGDHVWEGSDHAAPSAVDAAVIALPWRELEDSPAEMLKRLPLPPDVSMRAAAKYGRAVAHVVAMDRRIDSRVSGPHELEVSVDETESVTTPAQHEYLAHELHRLGVEFVSLAPRFPGRFEKAVDYIGDVAVFEREFTRHAEIASRLGPYKLSLHSGSDKFSIYETAARVSGRLVHLKTSGTSWLEALRTAGRLDPDLLASIYGFARERYPADRASYHVSAEGEAAPALADLDNGNCRQILHVTFGSVIEQFGDQLTTLLRANREMYELDIQRHFESHLAPFRETD